MVHTIGPGGARPLGLRHSTVRCALFDPYAEGALVLFTPPEVSAHDALKIDANKRQVIELRSKQISSKAFATF